MATRTAGREGEGCGTAPDGTPVERRGPLQDLRVSGLGDEHSVRRGPPRADR